MSPLVSFVVLGCGNVVRARIVTDRETGESRGFGYVEFDATEASFNDCFIKCFVQSYLKLTFSLSCLGN